jgi:hypothetical protein
LNSLTFFDFVNINKGKLEPLMLQTQLNLVNTWLDGLRQPTSLDSARKFLPRSLDQPDALRLADMV